MTLRLPFQAFIAHSITFGLILLLSACSSSPPVTPPLFSDETRVFNQADTEKSPRLDKILKQFNDADAEQQVDLLPAILTAASREQRWPIANKAIKLITIDQLRVDQMADFSLAASKLWLYQGNFKRIDDWLNHPALIRATPRMTIVDQLGLASLQAEILFVRGQYFLSFKHRMAIKPEQLSESQKTTNHQAIWDCLVALSLGELEQQLNKNHSPEIIAWLSLARIHHLTDLGPAEQSRLLRTWQRKWPNHIAAIKPPFELPAMTDPLSQQVKKIALILPLSGPLSEAGIAVQDGIMAGYFYAKEHGWQPPKIISYDSHQKSIKSIYQRLEQESIDLVIGPLQKKQLEKLASLNPKISVIALNYLTETTITNPSIIQFGLAAEDEALQLANNARRNGHKNAIIIQSNADWSRRAGLAFRQRWATLGGQTLNQTVLSEAKNYSSEIAKSLLLPQSQARYQQIERLLDTSIEFTPRRRDDVDVIILFANSQQAKSIKPLLAYHYASKLPVYSSSHIYNGVESNSNRDLNGIIFNEIPWVLTDNAIKKKSHSRYKDNKLLGRLFAMGLDAFYVYPYLGQMQQSSQQVFLGKTGQLSINTNRINRKLQLVQFNRGKIKPASFP
ncbi:MAG: hypothetical protein CL691_03620 [Cellvibrionales bacterium]|nr:hypothetical protein [Cellvibrionales bacterium]|tara:strand:+ start:2090 stop:3946 length:1857 start_codon:yes stop_codon:yes gene_type:complete